MNIKSLLEAGDLSAVVDAAITTNRIQAAAGADLDLCKSFLRAKALGVAAKTSERIVHLQGELGEATIIFPRPRPQAKKGADILGAESSLPAEVFAALFVKKTTIVFPEDFEAKIGKLTPAQRAIVANLVEVLAESAMKTQSIESVTYTEAICLVLRSGGRTREEIMSYFAESDRLNAGETLNEMEQVGVLFEHCGRYRITPRLDVN